MRVIKWLPSFICLLIALGLGFMFWQEWLLYQAASGMDPQYLVLQGGAALVMAALSLTTGLMAGGKL